MYGADRATRSGYTSNLTSAIACLLLAQICRCGLGRACPLCPGISDVDLFGYREGIIHLDAEVSDGALDFGVAKQELHGS